MVLGRGAKHRGASDIDVFDALLKFGFRLLNGRLERIEIDDNKVDQADSQLVYSLHMLGIGTDSEDTSVYERVQRLDTPVKALRESGILRDFFAGYVLLLEKLGRTAGTQNLDAHLNKLS